MKDVVVVSACRTAIGSFGGSLKDIIAARLASLVMREAIRRAGIDPAIIDDVRFGCCMEPVNTLNVTRVGALLAGVPDSVTAVTVNRVCISGMEAVVSGMAMIQAGMADVILAGGVEQMSGAPYVSLEARWGCRLQDTVLIDAMIRALHCGSHVMPLSDDGPLKSGQPFESLKGKPYIMGHTTELIAQMLNISREEMDEVALRSHNNVERATKEGDFKEEIVPVEIPQKKGKPPVFFEKELGLKREITNVNGSGIGLGHPVGSTGCRILVTLIHAMKKRGKTLGLATLCGGGGVSMATAIEML
jgi:acetyl-CoA C-acetyltransferase